MKRNKKMTLTLIALAALTFGSSSAWARHHWNNGSGMGPQGYSQLTADQQATARKLHNDFYEQTRVLRQQLQSKRYEYHALLTADNLIARKSNPLPRRWRFSVNSWPSSGLSSISR